MRIRQIAIAAAAAAGLLAGGPARAADTVTIQGKVLFQGKPAAGAAVSALGKTAKAGADGAFRLTQVPASHKVSWRHHTKAKDGAYEYQDASGTVPFVPVAAWAEGEEEGPGGTKARFFRGSVRIVSAAEAKKPLVIDLAPLADWEGFCRECHPTSPVLEPGSVVRPAPKKAPKPPPLSAKTYPTHRYRDAHPSGFDFPAGRKGYADNVAVLPLAGGRRVHCGTCHTFHVPGPVPAFAREAFSKASDLCKRCHR